MKRVLSVLFVFLLSSVLVVNIFAGKVNNGDVVIAVPIICEEGSTSQYNKSILSYKTDFEGNIYGPEDYFVDNEYSYLLNSANNTLLVFNHQELTDNINLSNYGVVGIRFAVFDGAIYVLGNDLTVKCINNDLVLNLYDYGIDEAITEFKIFNNKLYVGVVENTGSVTYIFDLSKKKSGFIPQKSQGYYLDENTIFKVESTDSNTKMRLSIYDLPSQNIEIIDVNTDFSLLAVQYLGKNMEDHYIIRTVEAVSNEDYKVCSSETIREIDSLGRTIKISQCPAQKKHILIQYKVINGNIYYLDNFTNAALIKEYDGSKLIEYEEYVSPLEDVVGPDHNSQDRFDKSVSARVTRSEIISIAASYHSNFVWTCTDENIAPLTNYTKPHCISGAGTYSKMPYCWGGFCTQQQFLTGLSSGGRAGNVCSGAGGHVGDTYGVDCSGYVSRCWKRASKYNTWTITSITTPIEIEEIQIGDAFLSINNHIMLFHQNDNSYGYVLYEATVTNNYDSVSHTIRETTSVNNYYDPVKCIYVDEEEGNNY